MERKTITKESIREMFPKNFGTDIEEKDSEKTEFRFITYKINGTEYLEISKKEYNKTRLFLLSNDDEDKWIENDKVYNYEEYIIEKKYYYL